MKEYARIIVGGATYERVSASDVAAATGAMCDGNNECFRLDAKLSALQAQIAAIEQEMRTIPADDEWARTLNQWADRLAAMTKDGQ